MSDWIDLILRVLFIAALVYFWRVVAKRERVLREPVTYLVTYFRSDGSRISYGSIGVDVRGGITSDKFEEVVLLVRQKTGLPDAFVMSFSRYES